MSTAFGALSVFFCPQPLMRGWVRRPGILIFWHDTCHWSPVNLNLCFRETKITKGQNSVSLVQHQMKGWLLVKGLFMCKTLRESHRVHARRLSLEAGGHRRSSGFGSLISPTCANERQRAAPGQNGLRIWTAIPRSSWWPCVSEFAWVSHLPCVVPLSHGPALLSFQSLTYSNACTRARLSIHSPVKKGRSPSLLSDQETDVQRGWVTSPRSHSPLVVGSGQKPPSASLDRALWGSTTGRPQSLLAPRYRWGNWGQRGGLHPTGVSMGPLLPLPTVTNFPFCPHHTSPSCAPREKGVAGFLWECEGQAPQGYTAMTGQEWWQR